MQSTSISDERLSYRTIFILWVPLAAMWIMMGIEMPLVNAIIARLADAKANLAAFGVTLAIALIVEAPVIQLLAAGTALADSKKNYQRLLNFTHILAIGLTGLHLFLGLTPLYSLLLEHVMGLPVEIIDISRRSFLWMFPWSAAVAYRRFWQGVLIRYHKTSVVPVTMVIRFIFTSIILGSGFTLLDLSGAEIGGLALSFGVFAGAVSSYVFVLPIVRNMKDDPSVIDLTWYELGRFYFPLALTNFMTFIVRPILSFGIARAVFPLESLAVWPVVTSVLFLFRSTALAYQEVVVSLLKDEKDEKDEKDHTLLARFSVYLGCGLTFLLFIVAVTPLGELLYRYGSGLKDDLIPYTVIPTLIVVVIPFLTSLISWYRGVLIFKHETKIIAQAVLLNSVILILIIVTGPMFFDYPGGIFAALAYTLSMGIELIFLRRKIMPSKEILLV
jgi:hypothetical protein